MLGGDSGTWVASLRAGVMGICGGASAVSGAVVNLWTEIPIWLRAVAVAGCGRCLLPWLPVVVIACCGDCLLWWLPGAVIAGIVATVLQLMGAPRLRNHQWMRPVHQVNVGTSAPCLRQ